MKGCQCIFDGCGLPFTDAVHSIRTVQAACGVHCGLPPLPYSTTRLVRSLFVTYGYGFVVGVFVRRYICCRFCLSVRTVAVAAAYCCWNNFFLLFSGSRCRWTRLPTFSGFSRSLPAAVYVLHTDITLLVSLTTACVYAAACMQLSLRQHRLRFHFADATTAGWTPAGTVGFIAVAAAACVRLYAHVWDLPLRTGSVASYHAVLRVCLLVSPLPFWLAVAAVSSATRAASLPGTCYYARVVLLWPARVCSRRCCSQRCRTENT